MEGECLLYEPLELMAPTDAETVVGNAKESCLLFLPWLYSAIAFSWLLLYLIAGCKLNLLAVPWPRI